MNRPPAIAACAPAPPLRRRGAGWMWLVALLLLVAAGAAPARAAAAVGRAQFLGREWYDLQDWSRANGFTFAWNRETKVVSLVSSTDRMAFAVDSQQGVFNGVKVWLSLPLAVHEKRVHIAVLDVDTLLKPLLKPTRPVSARKVKTIVLDPGHGGKDPGNREAGIEEKRYALLLAQQLRAKLEKAGFRVVLTRSRDTFVELPERPAIANRAGADLFLSLHFNSSGNGDKSVKGIEVFCLTPNAAASTHSPHSAVSSQALPGHRSNAQSVVLAYQLQKNLTRRLGMVDRGVKRARFAVLRDTTMPAVLVEGGFMSAPDELRRILSAEYRGRLCDSIVDSVLLYKRLVER